MISIPGCPGKYMKFNIKEVKNLVGFENADYFRKCFKEAYNMSPSEYAESTATTKQSTQMIK